jgi:hypothetical protein
VKESINANLSQIVRWFIDEERCIMRGDTENMPINQINLSEEDLDKLISQGEHITKSREAQAFRFKDCSN